MITKQTVNQRIMRRKNRIRAKIIGTKIRPRLALIKSNYALMAQLIDDGEHRVILSSRIESKNIKAAIALGEKVAGLMKDKKIKTVVFDRSGYQYHGVIKAFVEAIREGGVQV